MKTKKLTLLSMLLALYVVLSLITIEIGTFKFTLEAFPILVAAFLFGPIEGFVVGTCGAFVYQLVRYGLMPATILYLIPHGFQGYLVGRLSYKKNDSKLNVPFICILSNISVTLLNTLALYIQSNAEGWYSSALIFGSLFIKIIIAILLSIFYSALLPKLLTSVSNYLR